MVIGVLNHVDCICWKLEIRRMEKKPTHHCVFAHALQCQREMFCERTRGADELLLSIVASLVIVEEWESAVSEVQSHVDSILSLGPVRLAGSPGEERWPASVFQTEVNTFFGFVGVGGPVRISQSLLDKKMLINWPSMKFYFECLDLGNFMKLNLPWQYVQEIRN